MGFFDTFKKSRRQVNRENQEQGRAGEQKITRNWEFSGYKVTRTGKGHDLKAEKTDLFTGKKKTTFIEVKTGNSKLSKLQRRKQRRLGDKYVVERVKPTVFGFVSDHRESDRVKSKQRKSNGWGLGSFSSSVPLFGSTTTKRKPAKRKTTKSDGWGLGSFSSSVPLFGSTTTKRKPAKRKTTKSDGWGLGSFSSSVPLFGSTTTKRKPAKRKTTKSDGWGLGSSAFGSSGTKRKPAKRKSTKRKTTKSDGWGLGSSAFGSTTTKRKSTKRKTGTSIGWGF